DPVLWLHHLHEFLEIICGDLVSKAATAAVEHHHDLVLNRDPEFLRELLVAHVVGARNLKFQVMIAAAECADLIVAALDCAVADFRCVRARDATLFLGEFEVFLPTEIMFDTPLRPLLYQIAKLTVGKFEKTVSAYSGWDTLEKPIDDFFQARSHIFVCEIRLDQAHATVDVDSNSAGLDDTAVM